MIPLHGWAQNGISKFRPTTQIWHCCYNDKAVIGLNIGGKLDFNFTKSGKMQWPILQQWFCSVRSPYITAAIHGSHPSHRAETELLWNFGVNSCSICKVLLKFSFVTSRLQCPCWKLTIYRRFVHILSRYDLFWWLVPEKNRVLLAAFWDKISIFHLGQKEHSQRAVMVQSARRIALVLASFDGALPSARGKPS